MDLVGPRAFFLKFCVPNYVSPIYYRFYILRMIQIRTDVYKRYMVCKLGVVLESSIYDILGVNCLLLDPCLSNSLDGFQCLNHSPRHYTWVRQTGSQVLESMVGGDEEVNGEPQDTGQPLHFRFW